MPQQPFRILHVFGVMNRGGAETFVMDVYRHLDRDQVQFDFVVHSEQEGHYDREILSLGGRIFRIQPPRLQRLGQYRQALTRILREEGPFRGVHSQVLYFSGVILQIAHSCGITMRIANSNSTQDGYKNSWLRNRYRASMRKKILRHATHLLGVSTEACEALFGPGCMKRDNIEIVHNALNLKRFREPPQDKAELRRRLGLPIEDVLVGHVGRFNPPKNHRFLLQVFREFLRQQPSAKLILAGDGPLRPESEAWVKEQGIEESVYFLGVREDVPDVLRAMDMFLFPSLYEGFGLSIMEAQAAGLPCMISDSLSAEVDLGVGLIEMVSIQHGPNEWVAAMQRALNGKPASWETIEQSIVARNLEIGGLSQKLQAMYCG